MDSTNNPAGARVLVGRYRLGERLGRGGMGDVYRATDQVLARQVAVKLFRPDVSDEALDQRHESEARVLAGLNHPGLVSRLRHRHRRRAAVPRDGAGRGRDARRRWSAADRWRPRRSPRSAGSWPPRSRPSTTPESSTATSSRPTCSSAPADDGAALRTKLTDFGIARLVDGTRLTSTGLLIGTVAVPQPRADRRRHRLAAVRRLRPRAGAAGVPHRACRVPRGGDRDRSRAPQPPARGPRRARPPVGGRCWAR